MRTVQFNPEIHYNTLIKWWKGHKWVLVPLDSLPDTGLVCFFGDKPVCAGFLYRTNSNIAWLEWLVCDPKADRNYRSACIDKLIKELINLAKEDGYKIIFTSVSNKNLITRLGRHNFEITDNNMNNLIRVV